MLGAATLRGSQAQRAWAWSDLDNGCFRHHHVQRGHNVPVPTTSQIPMPRTGLALDAAARTQVAELLERAVGHFQLTLRATPAAISYLADRGIGGAIARRYGLGYARSEWRDLGELLEPFGSVVVEASGLTAKSASKPEAAAFDRFRHRVMFPVRRLDGSVAGFGGRNLANDSEAPKYLNSPEGVTFKKRELVYGLFEAQEAIRERGQAVMVEGYMDVLTPVQAGMGNVVGTLGTACTAPQVRQVLALARRIVFCFDGDKAGQLAAARVIDVIGRVMRPGDDFRFVVLRDGEDPDSFVRGRGVEAFGRLVAEARPLLDHVMSIAEDGCDLTFAEGRARLVTRARDLAAKLPDEQLQREVAARCASQVGLDLDELLASW